MAPNQVDVKEAETEADEEDRSKKRTSSLFAPLRGWGLSIFFGVLLLQLHQFD